MNFEKVYKKLMEGEKIRRKAWEPFMHLKMINGKIKTFKGEYTNFYPDSNYFIKDGWIIIDGDGKHLDFLEALEALKHNMSLTHKDWIENNHHQFIFIDKDQIAMCRPIEFEFTPSFKCFCSTDWEIMK